MNDITSALYDYICEHTPPIKTPEYQQTIQAYMEVEAEVKEKIGGDLLYKYQFAEGAVSRYWEIAICFQALRLGSRFTLEVLR